MEAFELLCGIGLTIGLLIFRQVFGSVLRNTPGLGRALSCLGCLLVIGFVIIFVLLMLAYD